MAEVKNEKNSKDNVKKENPFKKRLSGIVKFFKEVRAELKKVVWPSKKQIINNTITVIMTCLVVGVIVWIADAILKYVYSLVFVG